MPPTMPVAPVAVTAPRIVLVDDTATFRTLLKETLLQRFKLFGPPGIIFFDAAGQEIAGLRVVGFQEATPFLQVLQRVAPGA